MRFSPVAITISATLVAAVSAGPVAVDYNIHQQRRSGAPSFALQNGQDAQALNQKFKSLSASSPCTSGEEACVQGQLAQCVNGKFVLESCGSTLQCVALPLVNKPGTSITCDTEEDAVTRIANTGATGGLFGKRGLEARQNPTPPPACEANNQRRSQSTNNALLKRIAQTDLPQVAQSWQNLCIASGGPRPQNNDPCVVLAGINGINALLANADACAQQDNADAMIDFANSPGVTNQQALIANAIAYRQHPRNALNINGVVPSTPFCQNAPRNAELNGIVNGQLDGVDPGLFGSPNTAIVAFGAPGTCPFGQTADVATCTCH